MVKSNRIKVIIIPDIESVNYGRGVGYDVIEHKPPKEIGEISIGKIEPFEMELANESDIGWSEIAIWSGAL